MYCCYCNTHVIHIQIQLVLPHRAAEECQQPGDVLAAGPRVGRLQQPQRHGVRAGPRRGLQQVGAGGRRGLGVRGRAALLQEGPGEVTTCHVSPDLRLVQTHSCGGNEYRGDTGPLHVTRYEARGQLDQAWLEAGQQAGDCTRGRCCPRRRVTWRVSRLPAQRGPERVPAGGRGQDGLHRAPRHEVERSLGLPPARAGQEGGCLSFTHF